MGEFGNVSIPLHTFSSCWSDATGAIIKSCDDDSKYCPPKSVLENVQTISVWAEGVGGQVHLEIKSIFANECESKELLK